MYISHLLTNQKLITIYNNKKMLSSRLRSSVFSYAVSSRSPSITTATISILASAKRTAYFVHHKKTPNADCMMFVVPNFRFRIGNQAELEKSIREALEAKFAPQRDEAEEDWDGPGPNLVGNKSNPETNDERDARVRKIAVEQFHVQRKEYLAQRDKMLSLAEAKEKKLKQVQSDQQQQQHQRTDEHDGEGDTLLDAACDFSKETEENLFRKFSSASATATTPRTSGGGIHRAASMPVPTKSGSQNEADKNNNDNDNNKRQSATNKSLTSSILNDDDEATYVNATYSFVKETMHLSPLAKRIFDSEAGANINEVVVGKDFVTIRRKNEEDLLAEKIVQERQEEQEEEERALADGRGEEDGQEGGNKKNAGMKRKSIYNDGQGEIIATSFGTLSGMVNTKKKENLETKGDEDDDVNKKTASSSDVDEVEGARQKLAKMYAENAETISEFDKNNAVVGGTDASKNSDNKSQVETEEDVDEAEKIEKIVAPEWFDLQFPITAAITDHLHFAEVAVDLSAPHPYADTQPDDNDSEVVSSIKELIAEHLRPLLQSDGGDLRFVGFFPESGSVIRVEMLGSCKTCKKSDTTLKDLIERTIRHFIPEVLGVEEANKSVKSRN